MTGSGSLFRDRASWTNYRFLTRTGASSVNDTFTRRATGPTVPSSSARVQPFRPTIARSASCRTSNAPYP